MRYPPYTQAVSVPPEDIQAGDWILPDGFSMAFKVGQIIKNPTWMHAYEFRMTPDSKSVFPTLARYGAHAVVVRTRKAGYK